MASETLLVTFLLLLSVLFFVPRVLQRILPHPISEVLLGLAAGLLAPQFFAGLELLEVLSALGIITLFVFAGLDTDPVFIRKHKQIFIENVVAFLVVFGLVGWILKLTAGLSWQTALLTSLALVTPSASFILSISKNAGPHIQTWVEAKALAAEIVAVLVMAILLGADNAKSILLSFGVLAVLVLVVPLILRELYKAIFSKLIGTEFSFILVIALLAAFVTERVGLHFLVGAFFAGLVAKRFIEEFAADPAYKGITHKRAHSIVDAFGFFSATFAPFYFFTAGLALASAKPSWVAIAIAVGVVILVSAIRLVFVIVHRRLRLREKLVDSVQIGVMLLPTLVFTLVLAQIAYEAGKISAELFGTLMIYGLVASLIPGIIAKDLPKWKAFK